MTFHEWLGNAIQYWNVNPAQRFGQALSNSLFLERKDIASLLPREVDPWEVKNPQSDPTRILDFLHFVEDNWDHDELHG